MSLKTGNLLRIFPLPCLESKVYTGDAVDSGQSPQQIFLFEM